MDLITIMIMGIATAANLAIIKIKLEKSRNADALVDGTILVALGFIFSGTISGLAVATVASMFISGYLYISPPDLLIEMWSEDDEEEESQK